MPVISQPSCLERIRRSRELVVVVVFVILMLDVLMMTSIDPILPDILRNLDEFSNDSLLANCSQQAHALSANHSNVTLVNRALTNEKRDNCTCDQSDNHMSLATLVGIMVAAKPGTELITNILVGALVDRIGHKWPMTIGFLFNFVSTVGFAYGNSYLCLMLTRVAQAVGSSLSVVSGLAFLASVYTQDEERSKASSMAFGGISLGIILGYPYGCVVYEFLGREAPFLILAGATVADGALRLLISVPSDKNSKKRIEQNGGMCSLLSDVYILLGLGCVFLPHVGLGVFLATGPAWMLDRLHAKQWMIGVVLAIAVIFHFSAQFVTGYLSVKYGRWKFCWIGMVLFGTGMTLYPLCENIWEVLGPETIVRMGHGTVLCVTSPLLGHMADIRHNSQYGAVYGLYTASYNLGLSIGPIVGGTLLKWLTFERLYWATGGLIIAYSCVSLAFRNPTPRASLQVLTKRPPSYGSIEYEGPPRV